MLGKWGHYRTTSCLQVPSRWTDLVTYHPRLAAEVVYGVERVDRRKPSILQADDQAPVVLSQGHAVGMLSNQDEVRFE